MPTPVYFDTSVVIEMLTPRSKVKTRLRALLADLQERNVRIYTSIITVQELSVATHRQGAIAKDTWGDVRQFARVCSITKEIALTAAKREAELKDIVEENEKKQDPKKPLTESQKLDRACENRRRKWDCFHIATAQVMNCTIMYSTDPDLQKRPKQLGIPNLKIIAPPEGAKKVPPGTLITDETPTDFVAGSKLLVEESKPKKDSQSKSNPPQKRL